jgi:pyruvate/2-oxoglutarate/acetoin dehydrogenase E1 component
MTYGEAIRAATEELLRSHDNVAVFGLGATGPSGVFGTLSGLARQFGSERVVEIPASEAAITNVCLGASILGVRPILVHQRLDFALLSMDSIVNQIAKWRFMFNEQLSAPVTIRVIVGRGWGQGPQHSQALVSWFAHVPGLNVVAPTRPSDAYEMLLQAVRGDKSTIFIEHRWLHGMEEDVQSVAMHEPVRGTRVAVEGCDISIAAYSYMTIEALKAATQLKSVGVDAEVLDLRYLRPLDTEPLISSVRKTGKILITDLGYSQFGVAAEISALITETCWQDLELPPKRLGLPFFPTPTSPYLTENYYPRSEDISNTVLKMLNRPLLQPNIYSPFVLDVPDSSLKGPY